MWMAVMGHTLFPNDEASSLRIVVMGSLPPDMSSFESWASCRAAILLPMDSLQLSLFDLYALGLPLMLPDPQRLLPIFLYCYLPQLKRNYSDPGRAPLRPWHDVSAPGRKSPIPF